MVGKVLPPDLGISHELFGGEGDGEGEGEGDGDGEGGDGEGEGESGDKVDKNDILHTFKHKYVKDVVREKKIHFWLVPRLGSFMAVPLTYKSCLSEIAIDKAIENWHEVLKKKAE